MGTDSGCKGARNNERICLLCSQMGPHAASGGSAASTESNRWQMAELVACRATPPGAHGPAGDVHRGRADAYGDDVRDVVVGVLINSYRVEWVETVIEYRNASGVLLFYNDKPEFEQYKRELGLYRAWQTETDDPLHNQTDSTEFGCQHL